jgi:hypothetical protein
MVKSNIIKWNIGLFFIPCRSSRNLLGEALIISLKALRQKGDCFGRDQAFFFCEYY